MFLAGLTIGIFIGVVFGVVIVTMIISAKRADDNKMPPRRSTRGTSPGSLQII
jgi:hypothetical protein